MSNDEERHLAVAWPDPVTRRISITIAKRIDEDTIEFVDSWDCSTRAPLYDTRDTDSEFALEPALPAASLSFEEAVAVRDALDNALNSPGGELLTRKIISL